MHRIQRFCTCTLCFCALLVGAGCGSNPTQTSSGGNTPPVTNPPTTPTTPAPSSIAEPSVYVMGGSGASDSILIFPQTANGRTQATTEIQGGQVSLDGAGNVYVLAGSSINEYSANSLNGPPTRSLTIGPGTAVGTVQDVMASSTGEIFISNSNGIAVFSPTATGNASPLRYILGPSQSTRGTTSVFSPGFITVDDSDNLYVQNTSDSTIAVFGPADTRLRARSGKDDFGLLLTRVTGIGNYITGMSTDAVGNLYVLCLCRRTDGTGRYDFGVFEFDPAANGNVAPTRFVTAPSMYPYFFNDGVSLSADGTIFVSAGTPQGIPTVFEFSSSSSGTVTPSKTVTLKGWTNADDGPGLPCTRGDENSFRRIGRGGKSTAALIRNAPRYDNIIHWRA